MLDMISREDMPEGVLEIVDIIGIDAFKELVRFFGGTSLYIPNEVSLIRNFRNRFIIPGLLYYPVRKRSPFQLIFFTRHFIG